MIKLLAEHNLEFLSLKGDCTCLSESTHVKMPHCWKSHVVAHIRSISVASVNKCPKTDEPYGLGEVEEHSAGCN